MMQVSVYSLDDAVACASSLSLTAGLDLTCFQPPQALIPAPLSSSPQTAPFPVITVSGAKFVVPAVQAISFIIYVHLLLGAFVLLFFPS